MKKNNKKSERLDFPDKNQKFYLVGEKALPEILHKVLQVKMLLDNKDLSIQDATKQIGISRASYYKYSQDVYFFNNSTKGKVVSLAVSGKDRLGFLSKLTGVISNYKCNILTIHQSIPINGITNISFSIEVMEKSGKILELVQEVEKFDNVKYCKILTMEEK